MRTDISASASRGQPQVGRVVVVGDSHIHAIKDALEERSTTGGSTSIEAYRLLKVKQLAEPVEKQPRSGPRRLLESGRKLFNGSRDVTVLGDISYDQALKTARRLRPQDVLVSVIGGNQHAVFSTIQHPQPFDFMLPGDVAAPAEGAELVPFHALHGYFQLGLRKGDGETIAAFRKATSARMIHLLAPPPKRQNEWIEQHHDSWFVAEGLTRQGVSTPELRLKFWHLQNRVMEEICAELGVEVLGPPHRSSEADGFLERPCYAGDATHANRHYGELVLQQIEAILSVGMPTGTDAS